MFAMLLLTSVMGLQDTGLGAALDSDAPIDLAAQRCELFEVEDRYVCTGEVRVTQGEAIITADKMTITGASSGDGFTRIEGEGQVRYASGPNAVSGERAVYDGPNNLLTVTGGVVVIQGEQVMVGGELVYNTETKAIVFTPGPDGRVRGLFRTASKTE